jgi:hypothetical protein
MKTLDELIEQRNDVRMELIKKEHSFTGSARKGH